MIKKIFKWYLSGLFISFVLFYVISFYYHNVGEKREFLIPVIPFKNQFDEIKSIKDYEGKLILVDFWFIGCGPCVEEMKYYPDLLKKYGDELVILSCSIDPPSTLNYLVQSKPAPWDFLTSENQNWIFFSDYPACTDSIKDNSFIELLKVRQFPTYFMINKSGEMDTPMSGLFSVEKELGGYLGFNLAFQKFNNSSYLKRHSLTFFIQFNILVALILFVIVVVRSIRYFFRARAL